MSRAFLGAPHFSRSRAELNGPDGLIEQRLDPFAIIELTKKWGLNVFENNPRIRLFLERRCDA
jgi:hypothetical protein